MSSELTITIKQDGRRWAWTMEANGVLHQGKAQTVMEAAADAEHLRSCLWWKRNKAKPDNGASLDIHDYVRPQKELGPITIKQGA